MHQRWYRKQPLLKRYITSFVALTTLIVVLSSALSLGVYSRLHHTEMAQTSHDTLRFDLRTLDLDILSAIYTLYNQLAFSSDYNTPLKSLCEKAPKDEHVNIYRGIQVLNHLRTQPSKRFISSIVLYYPEKDYVLSNLNYKQLSDPHNTAWLNFVNQWPLLTTQISWFSLPGDAFPEQQSDTPQLFFGSRLPWRSEVRTGNAYIVFAVDMYYLSTLLSDMAGDSANVLLVEENGNVLLDNRNILQGTSIWDASWSREVALDGKMRSTIDTNSPEQWVYAYAPISDTQWYLFHGIQMDAYSHAASRSALLITASAILCLLIATIISFYLSKRLYSPVDELMALVDALPLAVSENSIGEEYDKLQHALTEMSRRMDDARRLQLFHAPAIRNMLIRTLLEGGEINSGNLAESLQAAHIQWHAPYFLAMTLECDIRALQNIPQQHTFAFSLLETLCEKQVCSSLEVYGCVPDTHRVDLIVNAPEMNDEQLTPLLEVLQDEMGQRNIPYAISKGSWVNTLQALPLSYHQSCLRLKRRFYSQSVYLFQDPPSDVSNVRDAALHFLHLIGQKRIEDAHAQLTTWMQQMDMLDTMQAEKEMFYFCHGIRKQIEHNQPVGVPQFPAFLRHPTNGLWSLQEFCDALMHYLKQEYGTSEGALDYRKSVLEAAKAYINQNLQKDLSLDTVATYMHFNAKYFSRLFKELSGMTLSEYIVQLRIEKAAALLVSTEDSVELIAETVGYRSASYLSRKFHDYFGCTPREYRMHQKRETSIV